MIEVKGFSRQYGSFRAVHDVSFSISDGEVVGLLGHNGAGKTTIMKMMTGYLEPSAGTVVIDGLNGQEDALSVQKSIGYLPESPPLYPELTVAEYLQYAARLRGLDPESCVPEAIRATQLDERVTQPIETLSRGYRQRVGVAQAILHKPRFLILDEPSNGLDPGQINHMRDLIRSLAQHATVILSTHIMQEVAAVCDRVIMLRAGELVLDERLETLQRSREVSLHVSPTFESSTLTSIEGVAQVVGQEGQYIIELEEDRADDARDVMAAIASNVAQAGASLFELSRNTKNLERIFSESAAEGASEQQENEEVDHAN